MFFASEEKVGQFKCHIKGGIILLGGKAGGSWSPWYFNSCNSSCKAGQETAEFWRQNTETGALLISAEFGPAQVCRNKLVLSFIQLLQKALAPISAGADYCCVRKVWKVACQTNEEANRPSKEKSIL